MKRFLISFQLYKLQRKKVVPLFIFQGNNIFVRKEGKVFEGESKVQAEIFFFVWNVRFFIFLTKKNSPDKSLFYSFTHEKNKFSWKFFLLFGFTDEGIKSEIVSLTVLVQFIYSCKNKHEDKFSWLCFFPPRNIKISFHQFSWSRERKLFLSDWLWISTKKQFLTCPSGLPYLKNIFLDCLFALNPNTNRIIDVLQMLSFRHPAAVKVPSEPMFLAKLVN